MGKTHYAVVANNQGEAKQIPLRKWAGDNPESFPVNFLDSKPTTHQIRNRLKSLGWDIKEIANEVLIIRPEKSNIIYVQDLINTIKEDNEYQADIDQALIEQTLEITFSLEKYLQTALRKNITSLEQDLEIIDEGRERNTEAGRIDITAKDKNGTIVVIELKASEANSDVIAQILSYMQAISDEEKVNTRGVIVASSFSKRVQLAAKQIKSLKLIIYNFQFAFNELK